MNNKFGQSFMEYALFIAAMVAVLLFVMFGGDDSNNIKGRVQRGYNSVSTAIMKSTSDLSDNMFTQQNN